MRASISACASKSPCTASIPTFIVSFLAPLASPSARLQQVFFLQLPHINSLHGLAQLFACFQNGLGVLKVRGRLDDGFGPLFRVARLEDSRTNEHRFGAQLTDQRRVGRGGNAAPADAALVR